MAGRERKPKQNKSVSSPLLSPSASAWSQSQGVNSNVILHDTHTKKEIKLQQQTVHDHTFDNINTRTQENDIMIVSNDMDTDTCTLPKAVQRAAPPRYFNFARAASEVEILNLEDFASESGKWQDCISPKAILLTQKYAEEIQKKKITYICFNKSGGGYPTCTPSKEELKEALADIWSEITYVEKGKKFSSIVVGFKSEELAKRQAGSTRQTRVQNLVPEYGGKRNTKVGVRNISHDVHPWLVTAFVAQYGRVVKAEVTTKDMWAGGIRMDFQLLMSPLDHKSMPEICPVTGAETRALRLAVQGRRPSCYSCGNKGHLRAFCPEQRKEKKLPEAAQPAVPPVGAPEEATREVAAGVAAEDATREKSEDPPPHTVDIQPVVELEVIDPASTVGSEEEGAVKCPSSSTLSTNEHEDEEPMKAGDEWQVVGRGKASTKKRKKKQNNANQPQNKTAKKTPKGKIPKKRDSPQKWGYTVLRESNEALMDEVKNLQNLLGEDQVQINKQMGRCYQQQAEGRLLVKTGKLCYTMMVEKHKMDVGPFLPTITPELLRGPYGSPQRDDDEEEEENEIDNSVRRKMAEFRDTPPSERINKTGYTIVDSRDDDYSKSIMGALKFLKEHGACLLIGPEMGPSYQQPAEGRELIILPEYQYLQLVVDFGHGMGNWLPTITPELLTGEYGEATEEDFVRTEVNGLVSWVAN